MKFHHFSVLFLMFSAVMSLSQVKAAQPPQISAPTAQVIKDNSSAIFDDSSSPRLGSPDARVILVSFIDYNCSVCRKFDSALQRLVDDNPEVAVIIKPLAFQHKSSSYAAKVALTTWQQDPAAFASIHKRLMAHQGPHDADSINAIQGASRGGEALAPSNESMQSLNRNRHLAEKLGVWGTPATVFGDTLLVGTASPKSMDMAVKSMLKGSTH